MCVFVCVCVRACVSECVRACACVPLSLGFKGLVSCSDFVPMYTLKIFLVVGCLRKWFSRSVCVPSLLVFGVVLKVCPQGCGSVKPDTAPQGCLLYTSPSPRDWLESRIPSSA